MQEIIGKERLQIAIMWACGNKDIVKILLDHANANFDVNATDKCRWTALMSACCNGYKDVVQLLLDRSAIELNATSNAGWTAFNLACENGHKDVVQLLLEHSDRIIDLNARVTNVEYDEDTFLNHRFISLYRYLVQI